MDERKELVDSFRAFLGLLSSAIEFNHWFIDRGWISHPWIDAEAEARAVEAARRQKWEQADNILADSYNPDRVRFLIDTQLSRLDSFKPRRGLAMLALEDYRAERYHACVPVTLLLLDGMGRDQTNQSVLRQGVRLVDTETSFLELGPGLTRLLRNFCESRPNTSVVPITIPHRHGILHGTDIEYANRIVAAKAWAVLLAFGAFSRNEAVHKEPKLPREPPPSLVQSLLHAAERQQYWTDVSRKVDSWMPRSDEDVATLLQMGKPQPGTPEAVVAKILDGWCSNNAMAIAESMVNWHRDHITLQIRRVRQNLRMNPKGDGFPPPKSYTILSCVDDTVSSTEVHVRLQWDDMDDAEARLRIVYFVDGLQYPRVVPNGVWLAAQLWPLEALVITQLASRRPE